MELELCDGTSPYDLRLSDNYVVNDLCIDLFVLWFGGWLTLMQCTVGV